MPNCKDCLYKQLSTVKTDKKINTEAMQSKLKNRFC